MLGALMLAAAALSPPAAAASREGVAATSGPAKAPTVSLSGNGGEGAILLNGTPGHILHGSVSVQNLSDQSITVVLWTADIRTASNGNADYATTQLEGAGRWLTLSSNRVRLAPAARTQVPFVVSVPAEATSASHYAGIVAVNQAELVAASARTAPGGANTAAGTISRVLRMALPITIRLPGALTRALTLRTVAISVAPAGAGLTLGLLPGGSDLIDGATVDLRVLRDSKTAFSYSGKMGQLFPGSSLNYRIPWQGRPTPGSYQVVGWIHPRGAPAILIDRTIQFTEAKAEKLKRETPTAPGPPTSGGIPWWVWLLLTAAAGAVLALTVAVRKLSRRPAAPTT